MDIITPTPVTPTDPNQDPKPVANQEPTPTPQDPKANEPTKTPAPESDLFKRVSEFQLNNDTKTKTEEEIDTDFFSDPKLRQKIDDIQDPELKAHFYAMRKSGISGINSKMQDMADLRKRMEAIEGNGQNPLTVEDIDWTPDQIAKVVNNQKFVNAARQYQGASDGSSGTGLDDTTKKLIGDMQEEINSLKQTNQQTFDTQSRAYQQQEHVRLKAKYPDYDSSKIDTITSEMIDRKRSSVTVGSSVFEDMYKADNYNGNIRKAYAMGRKDERDGLNENAAPAALDGINTRPSKPAIEPQENESDKQFLDRIIAKNVAAATNKITI